MIIFPPNEKKFLEDMEECRIATSHDDIPHVKPVSFIFDDGLFLVATDYETRSFKNLIKNPKVSVVIDIYKHGEHKAILIQGISEIVEHGDEFKRIFQKFFDKFQWVRDEPWEENEAPFLKIIPKRKTSWGLG